MANNTPFSLSSKSQEGLVEYFKAIRNKFRQDYGIHDRMRDVDLLYQRENNWNLDNIGAKLANRYGDASKYQDITVPVVMPQVETGVTYQASVFLTGTPLFGAVSSPQFQDAAVQLETIIDNQAIRGKWTAELIKVFRDALKYNIYGLEVSWDSVVTASIDTDLQFSPTIGKPKEVIWEGNTLKRLDPYKMFWDTSVPLHDVSQYAEFAGYHEVISRIALKQLLQRLPDKIISNVTKAFESSFDLSEIYLPQINPDSFVDREEQGTFNWAAWAGVADGRNDIDYKDKYVKSVLYARILPSEFNIRAPGANTPQIWKFIIINNQHIVYAERQTNAHERLPILMGSAMDDGLDYQTKSPAENVAPVQQVSSALMNSVIAARRRDISDRTLFDPTVIKEKDINSPNPSAKIPARVSAYGKKLSDSVYPFPFRDTASTTILQELPGIMKFADSITGQNQATQGQFTKGNRTRHEFAEIQGNANSRNQLMALSFEANLFSPLKEMLKINILQFQGASILYSRDKQQEVNIDPIALRKAVLEFKISDGLIPTDKLINADAFQIALQTIGTSPQIGQGYNIAPMFSYLMKTQGAQITEFEKDPELLQYEQAVQAWQQTVLAVMQQNPETSQEQLPPQPKPTDFGLDAEGNVIGKKPEEPKTILQQVMEVQAPQTQEPETQEAQQ